MKTSKSRLKRGLGCLAAGSLMLSGASLAMVAPANAAPADVEPILEALAGTVSVSVDQIAEGPNTESGYFGWHEGYENATPAFFIATNGLHFGEGTPSQIFNGLVETGEAGLPTADLLGLIAGASTTVVSGDVVNFQVAVTWGETGWSTLRSALLPAGEAAFDGESLWSSSKPIGAIAANTPTTLTELTAALTAEGTVAYSGFGVQSDTPGVVSNITWDGTQYNFDVVPTRIAGDDRFQTAIDISQNFEPGGERVYVANGLNYPDALSAAPAAGHFGAALLLTPPNTLPANVAAELERLDATEIILVGGVDAVSAGVEDALAEIGNVTRVAGSDRYETSRAIAVDAFDDASTAYIATGGDFPDALSASPAATHFGGPVVLVPGWTSSVDSYTTTLLQDLGVADVKIAGGDVAVSAGIEASLGSTFGVEHVQRNAGDDRYQTAVAINEEAFATADTAYIATGSDFADALSGAALAGVNDSPLFVALPNCVPQSALDAITALAARNIVLLGGTAVLSDDVAALESCG